MRMRWAIAAVLALSARTAEAQSCPNCGGFHGRESSEGLKQEAASRKAEVDDLMKRFEAKVKEQREAYQKAAADRIGRIQAEQATMQSALDRAKRQALLAARAAEGQKRIEQARQAKATGQEARKAAAEAAPLTKPMTGVEAMRDRLRLNRENAALRQLERKEANDRGVPGSLEQVPDKAIYNGVVTPFEKASEKLRKIFDGDDLVDPTKD